MFLVGKIPHRAGGGMMGNSNCKTALLLTVTVDQKKYKRINSPLQRTF